jgi:GTPase-associated protein 1, N-terminal domain type 2
MAVARPVSEARAAQYLFGTLPADRSPDRRQGHQRIASTRDALSPAEVMELEPRLFLSAGVQPAPVPEKCVFFRLGSGRFVVAQVVSMDAARLMTRPGAYLAHALVFEEADLALLRFDPFLVLRAHPFERSLDFLERLGGSRDLPPALLRAPRHELAAPAGPDPEMLELALRAVAMRQHRLSLALVGEPRWTRGQLEALFGLVPLETRQVCTFDTWCESPQAGGLGYWAIGIPASRFAPHHAVVFQQGQRGPTIPADLGPIGGTDAWTMERVRAGDAIGPRDRSIADALQGWLRAGGEDAAPPVLEAALDDPRAPELLRTLASERAQDLRRLALRRLRAQVGNRLGRLVEADAEDHLAGDPLRYLRCAARGFGRAELDSWVCSRALDVGWLRGRLASDLDRYLDQAVERARSAPPPPAALLRLLVSLGDWATLQLLHSAPGAAEAVEGFLADLVRRLDVALEHRVRESRGMVTIETRIRATDAATGADRGELITGLLLAVGGDPRAGIERGPLGLGRVGAAPLRWPPLQGLLELLVARSREGRR